ncbi:MAG: hypothetical protein HY898_29420 [Deltaproteobacteria bacterium]|nr:hypothetical protein [Deltaproteobacteria bacterium]
MLASALAGIAACSVPSFDTAEKQPVVANSCKIDADCAPNGACAGATICVSSTSTLETVVFEVVPPTSAHFGAGDSFLQIADLSEGTNPRDLTLPPYADVTGKIVLDSLSLDAYQNLFDGCVNDADSSLPVHVTATRSDSGYGLPTFSVEADAAREAGGWRYHLSLPPAFYDLYVTALGDCPMPPVFLPKQDFTEGAAYAWPTTISIIELKGSINVSTSESILGWSIEVLEPVGGKTLSTPRTLKEGPSVPLGFLFYAQPADVTKVPLLRISPPKDVVAPSILWDMSVIDFDNDHSIGLDITQLKWSSTTVRARVESAGSHAPIKNASVTLRSTELADAPDGLTAVYETTVQSDADGMIEAKLVPGTYKLVVVPPDATSAIRQEVWTVAASSTVQAGRTILLEPAISVTGSARDPLQGAGIAGIQVGLAPWGKPASVLETSLGMANVLPRSASGLTAADGAFAVGVDPGTFLLSAQTDEANGFPWLIRTAVEVKADGPQPLDLGAMTTSYPLVVEGTLRDAWGAVQQARIRAYAPLAANGTSARKGEAVQGAVLIAETRSNEGGHYRLLLPSQLQK